MKSEKPTTVTAYIQAQPKEVQGRLKQLREILREELKDASEEIKYAMPTYVKDGNLITFGAYKKHISIYPAPKGTDAFNKAIEPYRAERSTLQFPHDQPFPLALIRKIAKTRIKNRAEELKAMKK